MFFSRSKIEMSAFQFVKQYEKNHRQIIDRTVTGDVSLSPRRKWTKKHIDKPKGDNCTQMYQLGLKVGGGVYRRYDWIHHPNSKLYWECYHTLNKLAKDKARSR